MRKIDDKQPNSTGQSSFICVNVYVNFGNFFHPVVRDETSFDIFLCIVVWIVHLRRSFTFRNFLLFRSPDENDLEMIFFSGTIKPLIAVVIQISNKNNFL